MTPAPEVSSGLNWMARSFARASVPADTLVGPV
jgi:hypothetical protein